MDNEKIRQPYENVSKRLICLSVVVPVYNEEATIDFFMKRIDSVFSNVSSTKLEIVFVNDGSEDATLETLVTAAKKDERITVVDLSRNFGKEAALTAGLQLAKGDVVVPIDVDLQDPPELIPSMLEKWHEGYDVVLARRTCRDSDSWAKRTSANLFYRLHNKISEPKIPENVGDFRLMGRNVIDALSELPESRRFMKGLLAWVGFSTA